VRVAEWRDRAADLPHGLETSELSLDASRQHRFLLPEVVEQAACTRPIAMPPSRSRVKHVWRDSWHVP
jgi:hypothetical protein